MRALMAVPFPSEEFWRDRNSYAWLAQLSLRGFAWEFLRRNAEYRAHWVNVQPVQTTFEPMPGMHVVGVSQYEAASESWASLGPLEDPSRDARIANVFWIPQECATVLPVVAMKDGRENFQLQLSEISKTCRIIVYPESDEHEHVLFTAEGLSLQIDVRGTSLFQATRLFPDLTSYLSPNGTPARSARQFADLIVHHSLRPHLYPPARQARRLMEVLQALDGDLASASRQEIAIALFGAPRVKQEWRSRSMQAHVRNAILRGKSLMNGGYKALLT